MTTSEIKEQLQEDILTILEGFGIDGCLEQSDFDKLTTMICNAVIHNVNQLEKN